MNHGVWYTKHMLTLRKALIKKSYLISSVLTTEDDVLGIRLRQLGFVPGAKVICERKAPWFGEPLLVSVRGMKVALTLSEADFIQIEEYNV